jgi:hypothetical protein
MAAFKIVQKLLILRRKGGWRREGFWFPMPPVRLPLHGYLCQYRVSFPQREWQTERDASHLAQQLAAGTAMLMPVGCFGNLCFVASLDLVRTFIHTHSGHPISPGSCFRGDVCIE